MSGHVPVLVREVVDALQAADGKIGPHTVAKARTLKARPSAVAAGPQADARPPV